MRIFASSALCIFNIKSATHAYARVFVVLMRYFVSVLVSPFRRPPSLSCASARSLRRLPPLRNASLALVTRLLVWMSVGGPSARGGGGIASNGKKI